jgi:hypothetical protein
MPRVGADAVNIQTRPTIVPRSMRPGPGGQATPASYDLPEVLRQGGDPNAFTNAIRTLIAQNPSVTWTVTGPAVSFGPFTAVNIQEGVDPIAPYGNAQGAPRGDRVYFLGPAGWVFAASVSGYWYANPAGRDSLGREGPAFRCGTLPSGVPDYSCFPLLNLPQGTLPIPEPSIYGRQPHWTWQPSPEPELEPEGEIIQLPDPPSEKTGLLLPLVIGVGAAILLGS